MTVSDKAATTFQVGGQRMEMQVCRLRKNESIKKDWLDDPSSLLFGSIVLVLLWFVVVPWLSRRSEFMREGNKSKAMNSRKCEGTTKLRDDGFQEVGQRAVE